MQMARKVAETCGGPFRDALLDLCLVLTTSHFEWIDGARFSLDSRSGGASVKSGGGNVEFLSFLQSGFGLSKLIGMTLHNVIVVFAD